MQFLLLFLVLLDNFLFVLAHSPLRYFTIYNMRPHFKDVTIHERVEQNKLKEAQFLSDHPSLTLTPNLHMHKHAQANMPAHTCVHIHTNHSQLKMKK